MLLQKYAILIAIQISLYFVDAQSANSLLPKAGECGKLNIEYFYNESTITEFDEYPWIGRIMEDRNETYSKPYCVAVLITKQHLLTNSHCIESPSFTPDIVVLGDWNTANEITEKDCNTNGQCAPLPQKYEIDEIAVHPDYHRRTKNSDIAVIRLKSEVVFSDYIQPICLPPTARKNEDYVGQYLPNAGFIRDMRVTDETKTIKSKNLAHIISLQSCKNFASLYSRSVNISSSHICNTCSPDQIFLSGSPLMSYEVVNSEPLHFYLVGLASFGGFTCDLNTPNIFARVSTHLNWIIDNIY